MADNEAPVKPRDSDANINLEKISDVGTIAAVASALLSVATPLGLPVMIIAALAGLVAGGTKIAASRSRANEAENTLQESTEKESDAKLTDDEARG